MCQNIEQKMKDLQHSVSFLVRAQPTTKEHNAIGILEHAYIKKHKTKCEL